MLPGKKQKGKQISDRMHVTKGGWERDVMVVARVPGNRVRPLGSQW